jgi:hypothetical protein
MTKPDRQVSGRRPSAGLPDGLGSWTSSPGLLLAASLLLGCGSDTTEPPANPQDAGAMKRDAASDAEVILACREAFASGLGLDPGPVPSFRHELLPMFSTNCTFGGCHDGDQTTGHLRLGNPCTFDPWTSTCNFDESLVTDELVQRIHGNLLSPSANAPRMKRVEPGKIELSFALFKLSGCQNAFPERTFCAPCGDPMPPGTAFREGQPLLFQRFATWVAAGAPMD